MEEAQEVHRPVLDEKSFEMLWCSYDSEMQRFWTRFNLFVVVQAGSAFGVLTAIKVLAANPVPFRALLALAGILSLLALLVVIRGVCTQVMFCRLFTERRDEFPLLRLVFRSSSLPQYTNGLLAVAAAGVLSVAWWVGLVWLEGKKNVKVECSRTPIERTTLSETRSPRLRQSSIFNL